MLTFLQSDFVKQFRVRGDNDGFEKIIDHESGSGAGRFVDIFTLGVVDRNFGGLSRFAEIRR